MAKRYDLLIAGGGLMASSIAYHLLKDGYTGSIAIFEQDPVYEYASTPRSAGGIRQIFSTEINIRMSRYSLQVFRTFVDDMAVDGVPAVIDFRQSGYLFLANESMVSAFQMNLALQRRLGVQALWLSPQEILGVIPELRVDDLAGAVFSPQDGYMDPYSVMQGYIKQAKRLGAQYVYKKVRTLVTDGVRHITGLCTEDGEEYHAPVVVNACGAWSGELSKTIGLDIPVVPLRRQVFHIAMGEPLCKLLPLTIDVSGVYFRHEGPKVITGLANDVPYEFNFQWDKSFFESEIWPVLANRCPNFERLKLERGWAGLYDYNDVDQNAIIGQHPELDGYYICSGFSGHGLQQAPAAGMGLSELIRLGKYDTIDMACLGVERFRTGRLVREDEVV